MLPTFSIVILAAGNETGMAASLNSLKGQEAHIAQIIVDAPLAGKALEAAHALTCELREAPCPDIDTVMAEARGEALIFLPGGDRLFDTGTLPLFARLLATHPRLGHVRADSAVACGKKLVYRCHRTREDEPAPLAAHIYRKGIPLGDAACYVNKPLCIIPAHRKAAPEIKGREGRPNDILPEIGPAPEAREQEAFAARYRMLNAGYQRPYVFRVGIGGGLFSELNNMIFSILYSLEHKLRFVLYSDGANFSAEGWTDFFLPFVEENHDPFHRNNNLRSCGKIPRRQRWRIRTYKHRHGIAYLTQDLFGKVSNNADFAEHCYRIPELGISGQALEACQGLADMVVRPNGKTAAYIDQCKRTLQLPEHYIALHIRGGDIKTEALWRKQDLLSVEPYIRKIESLGTDVRDIFIFTDEYKHVRAMKELRPDWRIHTLCGEEEDGFHYEQFNRLSEEEKKDGIRKILANVDICRNARMFIGTRVSNPSMFLYMVMPRERICLVDADILRFESVYDRYLDDHPVIDQVHRIFGLPLLRTLGNNGTSRKTYLWPGILLLRAKGNAAGKVRYDLFGFLRVMTAVPKGGQRRYKVLGIPVMSRPLNTADRT